MVNWQEAKKFLNMFRQSFQQANGCDAWGKQRFHLSDASSCTRKIWYRIMLAKHPEMVDVWKFKDAPFDIEQMLNMEIGHGVHERFQDTLVNKMHWCTSDDIEVPIEYPTLNMKGSVDAIIPVARLHEICRELGIGPTIMPHMVGSHIILDFKTKRDDVTIISKPGQPKKREHSFPKKVISYPDAGYFTQLQSYMNFIPELYPERYPDVQLGILLYFCKNDGRTLAIAVEKEPEVGIHVKEKAHAVLRYVEEKVAPPREHSRSEGCCKGWPAEDEDGYVSLKYGCPYYELCWRAG